MKTLLFSLLLLSTVYASPLHQALMDVDEARMRSLISEGADVNAIDKNGKTALHLAAPIGRYSMVKFLVDAGANIYLKDNAHKTALVYAIEKNHIKVIIYLSQKANEKPLIVEDKEDLFTAAKAGDMDYVAYYLSRHDINDVNEDGKTALHIASEAGKLEIAAFLLNLGANVKLLDHDGRTALNYAKLSGNKELVKLLTQH